jgi:hypothetical protein
VRKTETNPSTATNDSNDSIVPQGSIESSSESRLESLETRLRRPITFVINRGLETLETLETRRGWLKKLARGAAAIAFAQVSGFSFDPNAKASSHIAEAARDDVENQAEADETAAIEKLGNAAGLGRFRTTRSDHFLAIGDAAEAFRTDALAICELILLDYLDHFRAKGFEIHEPQKRLTVVALAGAKSFEAFSGEDPQGVIGGFYDRDTNRLIFYDFRRMNGPVAAARPEKANTLALVHETTHQLTFNTGLLARTRDVPVTIAEGLAMYVEQHNPKKRARPGEINRDRLKGLVLARGKRVSWIPIKKLIADDDLFGTKADDDTVQLAYAESWLLVHRLLTDKTKLERFRDYLKEIQSRVDSTRRIADAAKYLGDLDRLDQDVQAYSKRLLRGG